jgi:drug/metabolite transporter (DMT)-like permease
MQGSTAGAAAGALMLNALAWGLSWWPFKHLHALGVHPLWATAGVYVFSVVCLLAFQRHAWRHVAANPMLWLLAAASGMTNIGFNWAVTVGDVVRVVLLFYLMPAWSILLAWPLLGEPPRAGALLRLALALAGVLVVLKTPGTAWPVPHTLADWLALAGGFSFALTNILLLKLRDVAPEGRAVAMFGGGALMATGVATAGLLLGAVPAPAAPQAVALGFGAVLAISLLGGNLALQYGAARLPAHATALIMLSEIVFASVSSVLLGAAELTTRTWVGAALILAAAAASAWAARAESAGNRPGAESAA